MDKQNDSEKCCAVFASFKLASDRINNLAGMFKNGTKPILKDKEKCIEELLKEKERIDALIYRAAIFIDRLK